MSPEVMAIENLRGPSPDVKEKDANVTDTPPRTPDPLAHGPGFIIMIPSIAMPGRTSTKNLVTLTTDFGHADPFVGVMKGVMLSINPRIRFVDLCHGVPPGDVRAGAFVLRTSAGYFPPGTVHLAVVDPGVGTSRRVICARAGSHLFVGPDNGLLSWVTHTMGRRSVFHVTHTDLFAKEISSTFHGRDVFAPLAAHLAAGMKPETLGPSIDDMVELDWPAVRTGRRNELIGEVLYVDGFGNLITNIASSMLNVPKRRSLTVRVGRHVIKGLSANYASAGTGKLLALIGSAGFLEIALNAGSASQKTGLCVGDAVRVQIEDRT